MIKFFQTNRFLIMRRFSQICILLLLIGGNIWGWNILKGNLSFSHLFGIIPLADPFAVLQAVFAGAIVTADIILGSLVILALYSIITGRVFCSWVCPMNFITDAARFLRQKIHLDDKIKPLRVSRNIRYWVLGLGLFFSFLTGLTAFEFISPVAIFHRGLIYGMGAGWIVILSIFLFDLLAVKNGFCGHLCPLGGFYAFTTKPALLKISHNHQKCSLCMKCKEVCPERPILNFIGKRSRIIPPGECTNCGRCIDVCADDSLHFKVQLFN